jgi:ABC-type uncharacterized transport system permease subunit
MMTLDALCGAVPPEMVPTITKKDTAKEAWDAITVEDYVLRLSGMVAHLSTLSEEVKNDEIIAKMLQPLSPRFKQITIMIKTLLNVSTMSVAHLTGQLKEAEEAFEEAPTQDGKLYLTKEEWNT